MSQQNKEPLYIQMSLPIKEGLRSIAKYNHPTISNLIEEGARMVINKETIRMKEESQNLEIIKNIVGSK